MSKPTLGRGLGNLLSSERAADKSSTPRATDVGLRILIEGAPRASENPERAAGPNTSSPEASRVSLLRVTVVAALGSADVALLGWTVHYAITHKHALEWFGLAGCTLSTLIAAACGCVAVLVSPAVNDGVRTR